MDRPRRLCHSQSHSLQPIPRHRRPNPRSHITLSYTRHRLDRRRLGANRRRARRSYGGISRSRVSLPTLRYPRLTRCSSDPEPDHRVPHSLALPPDLVPALHPRPPPLPRRRQIIPSPDVARRTAQEDRMAGLLFDLRDGVVRVCGFDHLLPAIHPFLLPSCSVGDVRSGDDDRRGRTCGGGGAAGPGGEDVPELLVVGIA